MFIPARVHDPAELRTAMTGQVVAPGDAGWDDARQAWNLAADQRPALVAVPESIADVQEAVRYAAEYGMAVAPQGTGHQATAIASLHNTILVKTHNLRGVKIDAERRRAYVRAGDLWEDVSGPASELGLAPLAGSSPDVGVVGYSLGGGVSWLGRAHGLAANSVTAIAIVLADGTLVRCDAEHRADLFWALRGGGGGLGVVVGLEMELYPMVELTAGALFFDWTRLAEVAHAWREWVATVPEELTSILHVVQFPPLPEIPAPLRGRSVVTVELAYAGAADEADRLLAPLRALGAEMDTVAATVPMALAQLHMDPPHPVPGYGAHKLLAELPVEAVDAFVAHAGPESGSPMISAEIRHLGGALGRAPEGHGALAQLDGTFMVFGVGLVTDPASTDYLHAHIEGMLEAFAPYDSGRSYTNFVEHPLPLRESFDEVTYARLRRVKASYDPQNLFRASRAID
jgi:FAD/FMN-containing dehydrogenase